MRRAAPAGARQGRFALTPAMALLAEIILFGVLPIAFALWQLYDVRREQRRREAQRRASRTDDDAG